MDEPEPTAADESEILATAVSLRDLLSPAEKALAAAQGSAEKVQSSGRGGDRRSQSVKVEQLHDSSLQAVSVFLGGKGGDRRSAAAKANVKSGSLSMTSSLQSLSSQAASSQAVPAETLPAAEEAVSSLQQANIARAIIKMQASCDLQFPKVAFVRLVREITEDVLAESCPGQEAVRMQFSSDAVQALQESCEAFLTGVFQDAVVVATNAKRLTIFPRDLGVVRRVRHRGV